LLPTYIMTKQRSSVSEVSPCQDSSFVVVNERSLVCHGSYGRKWRRSCWPRRTCEAKRDITLLELMVWHSQGCISTSQCTVLACVSRKGRHATKEFDNDIQLSNPELTFGCWRGGGRRRRLRERREDLVPQCALVHRAG